MLYNITIISYLFRKCMFTNFILVFTSLSIIFLCGEGAHASGVVGSFFPLLRLIEFLKFLDTAMWPN